MKDLKIVNAVVVNEGRRFEADILVHDGRIAGVDSSIGSSTRTTIDARGRLVLPGMIDDQVHFREPGLTHKGDLASESRAAVAGGITSFMEMPNTEPRTLDAAALEDKYRRAAGRSPANYAFYLGASNDNLEAVKALDPRTAAGVKVFMGASTGNMLVDNRTTLEGIFRHSPTIITTHCEDSPMIAARMREAMQRYGDDIPTSMHPSIRSREACLKSSTLAVNLAREHGANLHVLHLTTADELVLFEPGPVTEKHITVEVCAHHLYFSAADYERRGNRIKCNPAIKDEADRQALLKAVAEDRIDVIATDHAPHLKSEKDGSYAQAAAGLPLVQDVVPSLFRHVHDGALTVEQLVHKTAHAVAQRFDVVDRGYIREGCFAELIVVDPDARYEVRSDRVLAKCGWSPFEGDTMMARVDVTLVNGHVAWRDGQVLQHDCGQRLAFDRKA